MPSENNGPVKKPAPGTGGGNEESGTAMALGPKRKGLLDCKSGVSCSVIASTSQVRESSDLYTEVGEELNRTVSVSVPTVENHSSGERQEL